VQVVSKIESGHQDLASSSTDRALRTSRDVIEGKRTFPEKPRDLIQELSKIPQDVVPPTQIAFRIIIEGVARPLRGIIHDDVYQIGREALMNAFRHSHATEIEAELTYAANSFQMFIRDNGSGINTKNLTTGRVRYRGLSGMRERAERMGAKPKILSRAGRGTEIELLVPGLIAFEPHSSGRMAFWGA
jgi:signal transduction histidine kinase